MQDSIDLGPIVAMLRVEAAATGGANARSTTRGTEAVKMRLAGLELIRALLDSGYVKPVVCTGAENYAIQLQRCLLDTIKFPRKEVMEGE